MSTEDYNQNATKKEFEQNGFVIIRNIFSAEQCKLLTDEIEYVISHPPANVPDDWIVYVRNLSENQRDGISVAEAKDTPYIIDGILNYFPLCFKAICDDKVNSIMRHLLNSDVLHYHFSNITIKAEYMGPKIGWHRDFPNKYLSPMESTFARVLICLDSMDISNGATGFNIGSHLIDDDTLIKQMKEGHNEHYTPTENDVYAICSVGDIVVIHPKVLHGGSSNRSPHPRRLLIAQWGKPTTDWLYYTPTFGTGMTANELRDGITLFR